MRRYWSASATGVQSGVTNLQYSPLTAAARATGTTITQWPVAGRMDSCASPSSAIHRT